MAEERLKQEELIKQTIMMTGMYEPFEDAVGSGCDDDYDDPDDAGKTPSGLFNTPDGPLGFPRLPILGPEHYKWKLDKNDPYQIAPIPPLPTEMVPVACYCCSRQTKQMLVDRLAQKPAVCASCKDR